LLARGLQGWQEYSLDERGRVAINTRFRDILGGTFHIMKAVGHPCLVLLSDVDKNALDEKLSDIPQSDTEMWDFIGWLYSGIYACTPDNKQGRILIPADLRKYADIELNGTVVISGANSRVEIWNAEAYHKRFAEFEGEKKAAMLAKAKEYGI